MVYLNRDKIDPSQLSPEILALESRMLAPPKRFKKIESPKRQGSVKQFEEFMSPEAILQKLHEQVVAGNKQKLK